jgi:hypothetical protein
LGLSEKSRDWQLARRRLKSMQRRPQLVSAFWAQAQLPL